MRNFIWVAGFFGLFLFLGACDNDVDLTADFKDLPIVYGLLDKNLDTNYIRIQKAFLPEDGESALDVALNPDSLYYDNLDVRLVRMDNGDTYVLERINGADEGIPKGTGVFANQPNYLYKLVLPAGEELVEDKTYELVINRGDNLSTVTASAPIVGDPIFTRPNDVEQINIFYNDFGVRWRKTASAAFYDLKMEFFFLEEDPDNPGSFSEKSILWNIENNIFPSNSSQSVSIEFPGENFYQFIGAELDDNRGFERIFQSFDFILDAGGAEIFDYINIGQANTGITSSQVIPTYTNLSEGFGVFSSRTRTRYAGFTLKGESRDSLANGIHTFDLGFED